MDMIRNRMTNRGKNGRKILAGISILAAPLMMILFFSGIESKYEEQLNVPDMKTNHDAILKSFGDSGQIFESETLTMPDGDTLTVIFFRHASLGFVWRDKVIYVDPLSEYADYSVMPRADLILVTHEHYDHLDKKAIDAARTPSTTVIGSAAVGREYPDAAVLSSGESYTVIPEISVLAVAAYNVSPRQLQFHPKERGDNGYVIKFGSTRVYVAGDTEPIPEMAELGNIDIAFLPVNQPYTMTVEQAAQAARTISPRILFPYHTGDTPIDELVGALADTPIDVRIHNMP